MVFVRWLPVVGLAAFFGIGAVGRAVLQWRKYGTFGVALGGKTAGDIAFVAGGSGLLAEVAVWALRPELLEGAMILPSSIGLTVVGGTIVALALALMVAAQLDLGASWRIGIDHDARPGLVTDGFYRWVRNPIFAFMLLAFVGFVAMVPTWFSLALAAVAWAGVRVQVAKEEAYLLGTYGVAYRDYYARVGRFFPRCSLGEAVVP